MLPNHRKKELGINWHDYSYASKSIADKAELYQLKNGYRTRRLSKCCLRVQSYQYFGNVDLTLPPHNYCVGIID